MIWSVMIRPSFFIAKDRRFGFLYTTHNKIRQNFFHVNLSLRIFHEKLRKKLTQWDVENWGLITELSTCRPRDPTEYKGGAPNF